MAQKAKSLAVVSGADPVKPGAAKDSGSDGGDFAGKAGKRFAGLGRQS
jgi:hypothetical protein